MKIQIYNQTKTIPESEDTILKLTRWICQELKLSVKTLNIIFTNDDTLLTLHNDYLNENSFTDVMTFNLGDQSAIDGEIYISTDRAKENAVQYKVSVFNEIARLIIHACLHLYGYDDKMAAEQKLMKEKEEYYLGIVEKEFLT
jgi:rRNA maturation RNase YbeY